MTVKDFHEMYVGSIEQYIDKATLGCFLLDYTKGNAELDANWENYKKYCGCEVESFTAFENTDGDIIATVVFDSRTNPA